MNRNRTFALVVAVNDETVFEGNLMRSPDVLNHRVYPMRGYASASQAYNAALDSTNEEFLVFLHQDVFLPEGWVDRVRDQIFLIETGAEDWGVIGVLGVQPDGQVAGQTYSSGLRRLVGSKLDTPVQVQSLDEIVLILRRAAGIRFDPSLLGFHLYGTDLCQTAIETGLACFVIDAFCIHNSRGIRILPPEFWKAYDFLARKWSDRCPLKTPCTIVSPNLGFKLTRRFQDLRRHVLRGSSPGERVDDPVELYETITEQASCHVADADRFFPEVLVTSPCPGPNFPRLKVAGAEPPRARSETVDDSAAPMRILVVAHSMKSGGAQFSLLEVVRQCCSQGDEVLVLAMDEGSLSEAYREAGAKIETCFLTSLFTEPSLGARLRTLLKCGWSSLVVARIVRRFRPDLVYTNTTAVVSGSIAARLGGRPHVWHIRENFDTFPWQYALPKAVLCRWIDLSSSKVIGVSALALASVFPHGNDQGVVCHNGVDIDRFCAGAPNDSGTGEGEVIGFFGAPTHRKGLDVLIRALASVLTRHPDIRLRVHGEVPLDAGQKIEALIQSEGLDDAIDFLGATRTVEEAMRRCDVIVVPSRAESFSRVTIEAMASGIPVVVSACGGPEELVEHGVTGWVFANESVDELTVCLGKVFDDPAAARRIAQEARRVAVENFSLAQRTYAVRKVLSEVNSCA